jgi:Tfp pilus assembly protein PilE
MTRWRNLKGLSLVELLITTSIVGMIMVGMVSIDYALRTSERQQSRTALVSLRTTAEMFDITTEAAQAFGDVATRCIQRAGNMTVDTTNYICIYKDSNGNATYDAPVDPVNDRWVCYSRQSTDLHKCTFRAVDGPSNCANVARLSDRILGTVTSDVYANGDAPVTPLDISSRTTLDLYFQITLKNRYDPTDPSAAGAAYINTIAQEYLTNPKVKMTSRVGAIGCSM